MVLLDEIFALSYFNKIDFLFSHEQLCSGSDELDPEEIKIFHSN